MQIKTRYNGDIEFKEEDIIEFKNGIPGFEQLKKFILIPIEGNEMFSLLHSIEDINIGLIVISPFSIKKDYEIKLNEKTIKNLNILSEKDVLILNTVTLNSDVKKITTNLRAPFIINIKTRLGEQVILNDDKYLIKFPLFKE